MYAAGMSSKCAAFSLVASPLLRSSAGSSVQGRAFAVALHTQQQKHSFTRLATRYLML